MISLNQNASVEIGPLICEGLKPFDYYEKKINEVVKDINSLKEGKKIFEAHRFTNKKWKSRDYIAEFDRVLFYGQYKEKTFRKLSGKFTAPENGDYQFAFYAIPFETDKIEVKAVKNGHFVNTLGGIVNIYGFPWKISLAKNDQLRLKLNDGVLITRWTLTCHLIEE